MTNPPPNNPAPGEGRLSFDSPDVQEAIREYDVGPNYKAGRLVDCLRAEHEARVAAEEELAAACLAQRLLARGNDAMFKEKLAAAESENAAFRKILKDIMRRCQQGDSPNSICYEVNEALAPAPTAEAAGSDASTEGRTG